MRDYIECRLFRLALSVACHPPSETRPSRTHHQHTSPPLLRLPFFFACPPTHPPYHTLLPTPVINFSIQPPSSLFSLHFSLPFFRFHFFRSLLQHLVTKKGIGFTVSTYSLFTKSWHLIRTRPAREHDHLGEHSSPTSNYCSSHIHEDYSPKLHNFGQGREEV
jgi:hypothetical protein